MGEEYRIINFHIWSCLIFNPPTSQCSPGTCKKTALTSLTTTQQVESNPSAIFGKYFLRTQLKCWLGYNFFITRYTAAIVLMAMVMKALILAVAASLIFTPQGGKLCSWL